MAIKVSQAVIDEFRKNGMAASIAKYKRGEGSDEFNEAIKRYYPSAEKSTPRQTVTTPPAMAKMSTTNRFTKVTEDTPKGLKPTGKITSGVQKAAKRKSGKIADSKNGAEFAGRAARDVVSGAGKAFNWLNKGLANATHPGSGTSKKKVKSKSTQAI